MDLAKETLEYGFNGATSFQKWIDDSNRRLRSVIMHTVSMEPLLFRNG